MRIGRIVVPRWLLVVGLLGVMRLPATVARSATGLQTGDYLIAGLDWKGQVPSSMTQISSPNNSALVIGRVLVYGDSDVTTAYGLAKQILLTQLTQK